MLLIILLRFYAETFQIIINDYNGIHKFTKIIKKIIEAIAFLRLQYINFPN